MASIYAMVPSRFNRMRPVPSRRHLSWISGSVKHHLFDCSPSTQTPIFRRGIEMKKQYAYNQQMDVRFEHQERIDISSIDAECTDKWFNQTLTKINGSVARVGIVEGEYHWHTHEDDDEFFFVLTGKLYIDLKDRTIELNPHQGVTISKGTAHRPRAPEKTVMLMVETATIDPIGDDSIHV